MKRYFDNMKIKEVLDKYEWISTRYNWWNLKWFLNYDVAYPRIWTQSIHKKWDIIDINDLWWIDKHYSEFHKDLYDKLEFTITYLWNPFNEQV